MPTRLRPRLLAALLTVLAVVATATPAHAVLGGAPAEPADAPYMVAVIADTVGGDQRLCGGTVLTQRWVLTASHCVVEDDGTPISAASVVVVVGSTDIGVVPLPQRAVEQVMLHPVAAACGPLTNPSTLACRVPHDLALLAVAGGDPLTPITLARPHQAHLAADEHPARVYGWGATHPTDPTVSDLLQVGQVTVHTSDHCTSRYPGLFDPALMWCASGRVNDAPVDACRGDSGGPLVVDDPQGRARQVGVTSVGPAEACGARPAIYTSVLANHAWIASIVGLTSFPDLVGSPHADAIIAVADAGITTGRADGTFGPDAPLDRGQMATFLTRALELPAATPSFPDVPADHPHHDSIGALVAAGITVGRADGTFGPSGAVTRGHLASFLARGLALPLG